jgi:RNA polymerase sigma factor (sigma-70 family)
MKTRMTSDEQQNRFRRWLDEHVAIFHHVARGFAKAEDRDDLMQEILLAVWKAVPLYRGQSKESTFLYRVSHNAALGWYRFQHNYRKRIEQAKADAACDPLPARDPPSNELLEQLYAAIRELPELDRSLILLSLDGLNYQEMASIHGLSVSNVGARLTRIRHQLSKQLSKGDKHEL